MSMSAPLRVPVEIEAGTRWFRLAQEVGADRLVLGQAAPPELEGVVRIAFHLPGDPEPIRCHARLREVALEHHAEMRALELVDLDEAGRARIVSYVEERTEPK